VGENQFEIIAGERRWRAAKLAGLASVPAVVRAANGQATLEMAIVENVQREDIGPLEAAEAYDRLIQEFGLTQEEIAARVGKSRSSIANQLRLLKLTEEARSAIANGRISEGHGRALLLAKTSAQQLDWLERILTDGLNVRQAEALAKEPGREPTARRTEEPTGADAENPLASALREYFTAPVKIQRGAKKGTITIEFYGEEDLTRIFDRLGIELR
jgi:ParB family chromosome partitioning protein